MRSKQLSLFSFMAMVTCVIMLIVSIYERKRADEIEARSLVVSEYRAIVDQDWKIIKHELQIQIALMQFADDHVTPNEPADQFKQLPMSARSEAANIRNSQLKLSREKLQLKAMKRELVSNMIQSNPRLVKP